MRWNLVKEVAEEIWKNCKETEMARARNSERTKRRIGKSMDTTSRLLFFNINWKLNTKLPMESM